MAAGGAVLRLKRDGEMLIVLLYRHCREGVPDASYVERAVVPPESACLQGVQGRMEAVFLETPPHDDVSAMLVDVRKL